MRRNSRGSLTGFLLVTFAISWAFFIPVAAWSRGKVSPLGYVLILLGTIAPSLVALGFTARARGRDGARALLARVTRVRVAASWYLFAALFTAVIKLLAALILRVSTGAWPGVGTTPLVLLPFAVAISTPIQAGEGLGWRGSPRPPPACHLALAPPDPAPALPPTPPPR